MATRMNVLRTRRRDTEVDRCVADINRLVRASGDHTRCMEVLAALWHTRTFAVHHASPDSDRSYVLVPGRDGWDEV